MTVKKLTSIILALIIAYQSLLINVFANSAEISSIISDAESNTEVFYDYPDSTAGSDGTNIEWMQPNDELMGTTGFEGVPDNNDYISDDNSVIGRISALLDIDLMSAQNMIATYGGEEIALSEAENYAQLREMFYSLGYPEVKNRLVELVISGYGSLRVAYSGIVAIALNADINDVILKDTEEIPDDDIYLQSFAQQLSVSPAFVAGYTAETGLSTETMYNFVMTLLRDIYPDVFSVDVLANDANEKTANYPSSPYYVNSGENEKISPVSGSLTYFMNLASIPGVNGMDIDLTLRYDSDRSVAQGEYKTNGWGQGYPNGGSEQYFNHEYDQFVWENKSPFMFGTGWRLNYDYIYKRDDSLLLVLADGREYKITGTSPNYTLEGYNKGSLTLLGINEGDAKYKLRFFDGVVEKFNSNGELLSKTDRFGNSITFSHQKISIPVNNAESGEIYTDRLIISDSHSTVNIDYNLTNQRIVLPDGNTILLSYINRNNDYLLTRIENQAGEYTDFEYQSIPCGIESYNYSYPIYGYYHPNAPIATYYYIYEKLYYNYITKITHPTGAETVYTYAPPLSDTHIIKPIASRKDTSNGAEYNNASYSYDYENKKSTANHGKKTLEYIYDKKGLVTKETIKDGDNIKGWVEKTYNMDLGLPTTVITAFAKHPYGLLLGYNTWTDGQGHGGTYPVYDTTSYCSKEDTYQYDSVGQIVNQVVNGVTTTNTYDSTYHILTGSVSSGDDGNIIKTENTISSDKKSIISSYDYYNNALSGLTVYTYDNHGNPTVVSEYRSGNYPIYTQNVYSSEGRLLSSTTSDVTISYTYDQMGRVTSETDGMGRTTSYQYDALGRLISETYPNNASRTYSYTVGNNVNKTVVTDELGFETTYNYNGLGDIISVYSGNQCLESTSYDPYRRVSSTTDGNGATIQYTYDYADRPVSVTIQDTEYKEQYSYEWILDEKQCKTLKTVVGDTVPSIKTVSYTDIYGRLIAEGAVSGNTEWLNSYTYDSFGNKISELSAKDSQNGLSFTNKYTYDVNGNITSVCNALNQYTYKSYDWLGNMLSETDLAGNVTTYTYDAFGRVLTKTVPVDADRSQVVTNSYDRNGNLTSETISEATADSPTVSMINSTEYAYDNRNNLLEVKTYALLSDPLSTTTYTYDAKGQVLTSSTGGYTTSYTYDGRGNTTSTTYPGGDSETFTYNAANNVISSTDRNGVTTTYSYNLMGKPTSITAGGKTKSYTYASNGSVLSETSDSGSITYAYDNIGRVTSETSGGKTTSYTYDCAGNVLTTTVNGVTTSYTYDALNRPVSAVNGSNSVNYSYNTAGRRVSTEVRGANGTVSKTTYVYNCVGAVTYQRNCNAKGDLLSKFTYTYDVQGNILTAYDSTTGKTANYTYDALGRLTYESKGGSSRYYTYDAAGNRTKAIVDTVITICYTYDNDGRLIRETQNNGQTSTVIDYTYDDNGNLTSKTDGIITTTYTFDVWGNMTSAAGADYTYNAKGLRTSKTVGNKTTNFTVVNGKVYSDGTYNYFWGLELITNGSVYYLYNAHGDVVQLVNASGVVTKTYDYDAYGNELTRDLNDANPFRYCGEYYDTETGLIYLRARYYSPETGRFISQDPAKDGINWYAYCNNNPVLYADSSGLSAKSVGIKYDRDAAIEYAKKYAFSWNHQYMKMDDWFFRISYFMKYGVRSGNDCANFVSQCLEAGGIEQNDDWYYYRYDNEPCYAPPTSIHNPYYLPPISPMPIYVNKDGHLTLHSFDYYFSDAWTMAKSQYEYFLNLENGYIASDEIIIKSVDDILFAIENYNIQKGDLLYFENEKGIHHATIISSVTDDDILFAAHTDSRFDHNLSEAIKDETVHIIRLKDNY